MCNMDDNQLQESCEPTLSDIKNQVGCMLKAISQLKSSDRSEVFGYLQECVGNLSNDCKSGFEFEDIKNKETVQPKKGEELHPSVSTINLADSSSSSNTDILRDNLENCNSSEDNQSENNSSELDDSDNQNKDISKADDSDETRCSLCKKVFNSVKHLYNHALRQHPGSEVQCDDCKENFVNVQIFNIHVYLKHSTSESSKCRPNRSQTSVKRSETLKCTYCEKVYHNYQHYNLHIEGHKRNKCNECGVHFNSRKLLKVHSSNVHNLDITDEPFVCKFCGLKFVQKRSVLKHYEMVHSKNYIICLSCGMDFSTDDELKTHEKTHKDSSFTCLKCNEKFSRKQQYIQHLNNHDKYQCLTCGTSYSNKEKLEHHEQLGHETKGLVLQHKCPTCGVSFHFQSSLFFHKKKHSVSGKDRYQCELCSRTFVSYPSYREHILTENHSTSAQTLNIMIVKNDYTLDYPPGGPEPRVCKVCNKIFLSKRRLMKHENKYHRKKEELKMLQCNICDFTTYFVSCMNRHVELHIKKKEFICEKCGDFFYTKHALADHLNYVHSEERNFSCEKCGLTFKAASVLNRHMISHNEARLYTCHCGQSYKFRGNLNRHRITAHGQSKKSKRVKRLVADDMASLMSSNVIQKKKQEKENASNSVIYSVVDEQTVPIRLDEVIVPDILLSNDHQNTQVLQVSYNGLNFPNGENKQQIVYPQGIDISALQEVDTILQSEESLKDSNNPVINSTEHDNLYARQLTEPDGHSFLNSEGLIHPPIEASLVTSLGASLQTASQLDGTSNQLAASNPQNLLSLNEYCLQYNLLNM